MFIRTTAIIGHGLLAGKYYLFIHLSNVPHSYLQYLSINSSINYNFYHLSVFITLVLSMSVIIVGLVVLGMSTRLEYRTSILKLWKPRTDIPIPISYFNQTGLYGVGMYVLGFRK